MDASRLAHKPVGHIAPPLQSVNSMYARLTFYQLEEVIDGWAHDLPHSLLVVGCDTGREFAWLARVTDNISAVDVSLEALKAAAQQHVRFSLQGDLALYDGRALPFADRSFDVVLSHHVLHHIDDPLPILEEMWRVSNREIVICEPAATSVRRFVLALGIRPRVEADGMRVHNFPIPMLKRFAASHGALMNHAIRFYPKPAGTRSRRWHRIVDRLGRAQTIVTIIRQINKATGRMIGTKVTAIMERPERARQKVDINPGPSA